MTDENKDFGIAEIAAGTAGGVAATAAVNHIYKPAKVEAAAELAKINEAIAAIDEKAVDKVIRETVVETAQKHEVLFSASVKFKPQYEAGKFAIHVDFEDAKKELLENGKPEQEVEAFLKESRTALQERFKPLTAKSDELISKLADSRAAREVYEKASWYQKPIAVFEHMPTKGKFAAGLAIASAAVATGWAAHAMRSSKSHVGQLETNRNSNPDREL